MSEETIKLRLKKPLGQSMTRLVEYVESIPELTLVLASQGTHLLVVAVHGSRRSIESEIRILEGFIRGLTCEPADHSLEDALAYPSSSGMDGRPTERQEKMRHFNPLKRIG